MLFVKKTPFLILLLILVFWPGWCLAMPPGALLYRTSSQGQMYGYSSDSLINAEQGIIKNIYSGHVGIYIGQEGGEDFVVEALGGGIVKTPLKYFVNLAEGEKFLGAKVPREATPLQRAKAVSIAKSLVGKKLAYDFDFKKQKGPGSGEWTCVGLTEKIYESADISNPNNLQALEFDPDYYAVDITPDGFDNYSIYNEAGDCFSENYEFSKIARRRDLLIPAPELIGFDAGLEQDGERYIFLPYTQFLQPTLASVVVDKEVSSDFSAELIRGKTPFVSLVLRWSLINNPLSSLKQVALKTKQAVQNLSAKIFSSPDTQISLTNETVSQSSSSSSTTDSIKPASIKVSKNTSKDPSLKVATNSLNSSSSSVKVNKSREEDKKNSQSDEDIRQVATGVSKASSSAVSLIKKSTSSLTVVSPPKVSNSPISQNKPLSAIKKNTVASSSPIASSQNNQVITVNQTPVNNQEIKNNQPSEASPSPSSPMSNQPKIVLINKVYSTDNNDWLELINPTDYDFDLAEASYRLEKAKTAEDPSLMMRIGNTADGYYPGGTIIKAHEKYLIVRDDANDYYLDQADAIATRDEFSWSGSGYTIYLGIGAISSSTDPDITAALGFGSTATYFQGSGPALEILDNYILNRIANNSDNSQDFNLILSDDPGIIVESTGDPPPILTTASTSENSLATSSVATTTGNIASSSLAYLFIPPEPLSSPGIDHLWHFDECYGEGPFAVGYWGCSREIGYTVNTVTATLTPVVDSGNFSLGFYFRNHDSQFPKIDLKMSNSLTGNSLNILFLTGLIKIYDGLPNATLRNYLALFDDSFWHHLVLVVNQAAGYWAIYIDGEERLFQTFAQSLPYSFDKLILGGDTGLVLIDELAIWQRPLSPEEILYNYQENRPFSPIINRVAQSVPELVHFWDFNEGHTLATEANNNQALDYIGSTTLNLWANPWGWRQVDNSSLLVNWPHNLQTNFSEALDSKDLSLDFWWRNSAYPDEGRIKVGLKNNNSESMSLVPNYYQPGFWFNGIYGRISTGIDQTIPYDDLWHHLALVYDSYRYSLTFYVDGVAKASSSFIWFQDGTEPNSLEIKTENYGSEIDDLAIWKGALDQAKIQEIFSNNK